MAALAVALPYIAAAGTVISTVSNANAQRQAGAAKQAQGEFLAAQYEDQAGSTRATAQRQAIESRRQGRLAASRAQAVGAATGSSTSYDVINRIADLESQGEYAALVNMYEGEQAAVGMENQANAARFSGDQAESAGNKGAVGTLLSGAASLAAKYGSGTAPSDVNMQGQKNPLANNPAYWKNY